MDLTHACVFLFTPGHAPQRFDKGLRSGADGVILDLEDAVALTDKEAARGHVFDWLARRTPSATQGQPLVCIRVNSLDSAFVEADNRALVQALQRGHGPDLVMVPKVESAAALAGLVAGWSAVGAALPGVIALIESARGLEQVAAIAQACPQVVALGFGGADLAADLGCEFAWEPLLYARGRMVQAAALARVALLDVPYLAVKDAAGLALETRRVKALGFTGKLAIHPAQVEVIIQSLLPSASEVQSAQAIVEAAQSSLSGVCVVARRMVDEPVVAAARRVLARHARATVPDFSERSVA